MVSWHFKIVAILLLSEVALGPAAHAAETKELLLRFRSAELTRSMAEFIGNMGVLTPIAPDSPMSVREIVTRLCGEAPDAFVYALRLANLDDDLVLEDIIAPSETIQMPPCPPRSRAALFEREVRPGDNFWTYYEQSNLTNLLFRNQGSAKPSIDLRDAVSGFSFQAAHDGITKASYQQLPSLENPQLPDASPVETSVVFPVKQSSSFLEAVTQANPGLNPDGVLQPGQVVLVPDVPDREYALPLRDTAEARQIASLPPEQLSNFTGVPIKEAKPAKEIEFLSRVSHSDCVAEPTQFANALIEQMKEMLAISFSASGSNTRAVPRIVVVDSGIYKPDELPGDPVLVMPIDTAAPVRFGNTGFDEEVVAPFPFMPNNMHGTNVATLSVGGETIAEIAARNGIKVELQPFRAFDMVPVKAIRADGTVILSDGKVGDAADYRVNRDRIFDAIRYSTDGIVNLSFGRDAAINEIRDKQDPLSRALFVVAAGNHGEFLDTFPLYPGRQGGRTSPNVLTVGSIDGERDITSFSNWSPTYVEIAAPGCKIPTLSYDPDSDRFFKDHVSGTSFSAPQVTWTAAAIRALRPNDPASMIKMRLLAAADIEPTLAEKFAEGRVLNVQKAIALANDVVDVVGTDGNRVLKIGHLTKPRGITSYCIQPPDLNDARLLKVVPRFDGNGHNPDKTRVYFADPGGLVGEATCDSKDFVVHLALSNSGGVETITGAEINDITFSWY